MQRRRVRKKKSKDVKKEEQSDLLEKNDNKDEQLGQGERELAAVAGGHISMEARVVISSWLVQIVIVPS